MTPAHVAAARSTRNVVVSNQLCSSVNHRPYRCDKGRSTRQCEEQPPALNRRWLFFFKLKSYTRVMQKACCRAKDLMRHTAPMTITTRSGTMQGHRSAGWCMCTGNAERRLRKPRRRLSFRLQRTIYPSIVYVARANAQ